MKTIPVLFSFARSGGTLVNQILGTHPQCLVLSEVNPAASFISAPRQAAEWLDLARPEEVDELARTPYGRQVSILRERAAARGKALVVRDWVTVNFAMGCTPDPVMPSGLLEQPLYLERAGLEPRPIVVARRARSAIRSARRHFPGLPAEADLVQAYLRYARSVASFPRVHLESLRAQPEPAIARIIDVLGLEATDTARLVREFHRFDKCSGNNTLAQPGRSAQATEILPPDPPDAETADDHPAFAQADALLGYD